MPQFMPFYYIYKYSKISSILISASIATILSIILRLLFLKFYQIDLLQVYDHPFLCMIVLFVINLIRFFVRFNLEEIFADKYSDSELEMNRIYHNLQKYIQQPEKQHLTPTLYSKDNDQGRLKIHNYTEQTVNMKTNDNNNPNNNNNNPNSENNGISDTENTRRIINIVLGGPIGGNQGLPRGTIIRNNEAILPPGVRMHPLANTTPNLNAIATNNIHPSNNPGTRPLYTLYYAQQAQLNWGDASNFPVGRTNGPFRIFDPENQIRNGYRPNGVNQPALHNIGMAFNEQILHANSAVILSRDMFTPQQERFILDHLQVVNPNLYIRLTGDNSMTGARRTNISWNQVFNNGTFVRNFPSVNYLPDNTNNTHSKR